jgi:transposase
MKRVAADRLVFLDESGANLSMGRTHAWIPRGTEQVEGRPMNWGTNLTMIGAVRLSGWVTLSTMFKTANGARFLTWVRRRLAPKLRKGDIVILDNAQAHKNSRIAAVIRARGARIEFLPPYSPDFNPIERCWALAKKHIRRVAPRNSAALRKTAQAAKHCVRPRHCQAFFNHAGYKRRLN